MAQDFFKAEHASDVISAFHHWKNSLNNDQPLQEPSPTKPFELHHALKQSTYNAIPTTRSFWDTLQLAINNEQYTKPRQVMQRQVLVVGCGPGGLRMAIELALMGCDRVVVIDKRTEFNRHNVLHLWPFTIQDIKALGGKDLYRKFATGEINHVSIRRVQLLLLKIALVLGVEIQLGVGFKDCVEVDDGWKAELTGEVTDPLHEFRFNILVGAEGERSQVAERFEFGRRELQFGQTIGITANLATDHLPEERMGSNENIGGRISYLNQGFFQTLHDEHGIELENLVYYKDETHYIVMTPKKACLVKYGVIIDGDAPELLAPTNLDQEKLVAFARTVATSQNIPEQLDFVRLAEGRPDVCIFDFSKKAAAVDPSKMIQPSHPGHTPLFVCLVGDALIAPFWPQGTGLAHAVLSVLDACWIIDSLGEPGPEWTSDRVAHWLEKHKKAFTKLQTSTASTIDFGKCLQSPLEPFTRYRSTSMTLR